MAINFDLNDLLAFRAVAELSSFRKAAESVHLSQPAFSRRIDKLEQALGVRLLERTTRRVTLTAVGRDFERKVRELLDDLDAHAARHPRRRRHAHGRGDGGLRAVDGVLLPVAGDPPLPRALPEGAGEGARCRAPTRCSPRWRAARPTSASTSSARRKADIEFKPLRGGAVRRRMPARPPAGEAAPRELGAAGALRLHLGRPDVGQPRPARPGAGRRRRAGRRRSTRRST